MGDASRIVLLHGVVDAFDPAGALVDRTLVEHRALEQYLAARRPFVPWDEVPDGSGDILTIDDATRAGAEACRIAVSLGHAVTFFVNPKNIADGQVYFFTVLSAAIDTSRCTSVTHRGVDYPLSSPSMRLTFRRTMKAVLLDCPGEEERERELAKIVDALGVGKVVVPDHHLPITPGELRDLRDLGVRIENHGWDHVEIARLSVEGFREHIVRGRDWLRAHIGVPADSYAVPFGNTFVQSFQQHISGVWFLATRDAPPAQYAERCWNRIEISDEVQLVKV